MKIIEVFCSYIHHSLVFVCIYVHVVGYIQYLLVREVEDRTPLKLCLFCMSSCEVFLHSVRLYFFAGHPQAVFNFPVSKNSAQSIISDLWDFYSLVPEN